VKLGCERDKVANEVLTSEQSFFQALLILGSFYIGPVLHSAVASGNTLVYDTFQGIGFAADALVPYNQVRREMFKSLFLFSSFFFQGFVERA